MTDRILNLLCFFGHDFKWDRVYDGFGFAEALVCRRCSYCPSQPLGPPLASRIVRAPDVLTDADKAQLRAEFEEAWPLLEPGMRYLEDK